MDQHGTVGLVGWIAAMTLADYHMIAASSAATLTCVYMGIVIYKKLKESK